MLQAYTPRSNGHWVKLKETITKLTTPLAVVSKDKHSPRAVKHAEENKASNPKDPDTGMKNAAIAVASVFQWFSSESAPQAPSPKAAAAAAPRSAAQPAEKPLHPFDLQEIPAALEAQGYMLAAKLMRKWFAAPVYRLGSMDKPPAGTVDSSTVKLKDIRKFSYVEDAYQELMDKVIKTPAAQARLQAILQGLSEAGVGGLDNSALLGSDLLKVHRDYMFAHIAVGRAIPGYCADIKDGVNNTSKNTTDDLEMALGQVFLCAAVSRVGLTRTSTETRAYVKEIAVYMLAPYHFSMGPRYRGHWNRKQVALISDGSDFVGCPVYEGKDKYAKDAVLRPVTDADFDQWRDKHHSGGDMLVLSDAARRTYEKEFWLYDEQEEGFSVALTPLELSAVLSGGSIEHTSTGTRLWGAVGMIGGAIEMVGGMSLLVTPEPVLTKVAGAVFLAHGSDTLTTGWKQVLAGQDHVSYTQETATQAAAMFGASAPMAMAIGMSFDMTIGILDGNAVKALRLTGVKNGILDIKLEEDTFRAEGAHPVTKHVAKDETYLRGRLPGTTMRAATSFKNAREASVAVSTVLKQHSGAIQAWVKSGSRAPGVFVGAMSSPVGYGVVRATGQVQQGFTDVRIVLKRTQQAGRDFFVLTAYPTL